MLTMTLLEIIIAKEYTNLLLALNYKLELNSIICYVIIQQALINKFIRRRGNELFSRIIIIFVGQNNIPVSSTSYYNCLV